MASYRVAALYRFTRFPDPAAIQGPLAALCCSLGVKGTLLLAREGINGTIAGEDAAIEAVLTHIRALPGCADLTPKTAWAERMPFYRMKVRLKKEIVTLGEPDLDPTDAGTYVEPADWNALISDPDILVIDTRNAYEVAVGRFEGAIDPQTTSFADFPAWFRDWRKSVEAERSPDAPLKVAMYCTGGIRCEKSTAFLKAEGVEQVFHLKGGVLDYLEQIPQPESLWRGECFVFDERVSVGHGLAKGDHVLCRGCRMPVSPQDQASPLYVEGVACPACHDQRSEEQKARAAERHRQVLHCEALGVDHVGATLPTKTD
ncbi:rhodanese domain-containing protein [Caulobacter vibrioides]|uniref:tRNA uridine(34) hydroxylase n=1 Tax=Caulobacter vibrioides TaxID=155892 RepID=A0A290MKS5_CAUVI|nr:rhodanese-related sulfurtransferase [Caulobacter vibrioides]ATC32666.1 rhodanese domain-containing protein [Caulobacter vibrioides]